MLNKVGAGGFHHNISVEREHPNGRAGKRERSLSLSLPFLMPDAFNVLLLFAFSASVTRAGVCPD
jgi:hypothetical protein